MRTKTIVMIAFAAALSMSACSLPSGKVKNLRLGMVPEEVLKVMGEPFTVRAAKVYEEEQWQEAWEYIPPVFSVAGLAERYDKTYWLVFENGKLVQWGEPGDFSGKSTAALPSGESLFPVIDYTPVKSGQ